MRENYSFLMLFGSFLFFIGAMGWSKLAEVPQLARGARCLAPEAMPIFDRRRTA